MSTLFFLLLNEQKNYNYFTGLTLRNGETDRSKTKALWAIRRIRTKGRAKSEPWSIVPLCVA